MSKKLNSETSTKSLFCDGWFSCYLKKDTPDGILRLLVYLYFLNQEQTREISEKYKAIFPFLSNLDFLDVCEIDLFYSTSKNKGAIFTDYEYGLMYKELMKYNLSSIDGRYRYKQKKYEDEIIKPLSAHDKMVRYMSFLQRRNWESLYLNICMPENSCYNDEFIKLANLIYPWIDFEEIKRQNPEEKYLYFIDFGLYQIVSRLDFPEKEEKIKECLKDYYRIFQPAIYDKLYGNNNIDSQEKE